MLVKGIALALWYEIAMKLMKKEVEHTTPGNRLAPTKDCLIQRRPSEERATYILPYLFYTSFALGLKLIIGKLGII